MNWMTSRKIVLASQSPRRKELLQLAGFQFEVKIADVDEDNIPSNIITENIPVYLAELKARKIASDLKNNDDDSLILAADSLVFQTNKIFTKPKDRDDAIRIISALSSSMHTVITGVCLLDQESMLLDSVYTHVTFKKITTEEIEYYVDTYQPYDKAGAYGIQDWIGLCKLDKIEGSYTNIMGLPMEKVYQMLKIKMNNERQ